MNTAITKHAWGRKVLAIVLAAFLVLGLLQAVAPMTAYATETTVNIGEASTTDTPDGIKTVIETALVTNDTVTVTGSLSGVTTWMVLNIPEGKTVVWKADYSGILTEALPLLTVGGLGGGTLVIDSGGKVIVTSSEYSDAISLSTDKKLIVNGGEVSSNARYGINVGNYSTGVSIEVDGGTVSAAKNGICVDGSNANLKITDGEVSSSGGAGIMITPNNGEGSATFTMSGGTVKTTSTDYGAIFMKGNITAGISGGNVIGGNTVAALSAGGSTALAITGGSFSNIGTASSLVYISDSVALYVAGGTFSGQIYCIDMESGFVGAGYYTGSKSNLFTIQFSPDIDMFAIDTAPILTRDTVGGTAYTYSATAHEGEVVASLPTGLTITGVTATPPTATHSFSGNTVTFAGTYDESAITLDVTGTLAGGRIPVNFTTDSFGVNIYSDTTAPTLSAVGVSGASQTSATLNFTSNETGTYYYLVYAAADGMPSADTVKAQGTAVAKGTGSAAASTNTVGITGLSASTAYKTYVVVEDAATNLSTVNEASFSTTATPPTVTGVTVTPDVIKVQKGTTQQFAATVTGTNDPAQTVNWSLPLGYSGSSTIDNTGLLKVAADETEATLTVTATSTVDTSKSGSAIATVTSIPSTPDNIPVSISDAVAKEIKDKAYTGKSVKPDSALTYKKATLKKGTDYTVSYKNNTKIGKATVTITGKGKYTGTKTITFNIIPPKASVSKVVAGKNQLKVTWKKANAAQKITKYEVRYKIKGAKKWQTKTASAKSTGLTIKKLQKGKTYQVQVRSYKTVNKAIYYSAWSAVKTSGKVK
jgi:hypothetical protein